MNKQHPCKHCGFGEMEDRGNFWQCPNCGNLHNRDFNGATVLGCII